MSCQAEALADCALVAASLPGLPASARTDADLALDGFEVDGVVGARIGSALDEEEEPADDQDMLIVVDDLLRPLRGLVETRPVLTGYLGPPALSAAYRGSGNGATMRTPYSRSALTPGTTKSPGT